MVLIHDRVLQNTPTCSWACYSLCVCVCMDRQPGLVTATNGPNTKCRVLLDRDMAEKWSVSLAHFFC